MWQDQLVNMGDEISGENGNSIFGALGALKYYDGALLINPANSEALIGHFLSMGKIYLSSRNARNDFIAYGCFDNASRIASEGRSNGDKLIQATLFKAFIYGPNSSQARTLIDEAVEMAKKNPPHNLIECLNTTPGWTHNQFLDSLKENETNTDQRRDPNG